ncbi:MAG: hypothetical protein DRQ47_07530 [Gammaproteobacteria bacterium]|nr:MAG: hypothetical protein DRQ47_07530 [Gammaproteobacteria bacterium]
MSANTLNDAYLNDEKNIKVIQNYNSVEVDIDGNEWDYVFGFFKKAMKDVTAAENFAQSIFQVSRQTNVSAVSIVQSMKGQAGLELNASLSYYLNGIRSNATLLGVSNIVKPNFYAGRNVHI